MDRQQAEQEVTLVRVGMETESLEVSHRARGSHDWIKCTVAFVAGLTVALVVAIILHYFIFPPSCNQGDTSKFTGHYKLQHTSEPETYNIFTADKAATYLIYGWVKRANATTETFVMDQFWTNLTRTIETRSTNTTEVFLFNKVMLVDNTTVRLRFKSNYIDNLFHVYEL